jgi:two-component system KDP operon response regulator KdpE
MTLARILIVDADPRASHAMKAVLRSAGYEVAEARDCGEASREFGSNPPDLVILNIDRPYPGHAEFSKAVRALRAAPIIAVTAGNEGKDNADTLDGGAADVIARPCNPQELLARIRAVLRRTSKGPGGGSGKILCGGIEIDLRSREARVRGEPVHLTPTEFCLLRCLAMNFGRVVPHSELLSAIWGSHRGGREECLRVFVGSLRKKIEENPREPVSILTDSGVGYRLATRPAAERAARAVPV